MKHNACTADLVREAAQFALRGSNVRCDLQIDADLRPSEVDEGQIAQVLHNLMINAEDGRTAVAIYREALAARRKFDAVILDLTVPGGMGGKETVRELQAIDPHVRALVFSGYSNDPVMANH